MRSRPTTSVGAVTTYLIATDSDDLFGLLDAAIGGTASLVRVSSGQAVRPAVRELDPDLVVLDLQIGTMGAMAVCKDLRLEEGAGRLPRQNVLMLLDRPAIASHFLGASQIRLDRFLNRIIRHVLLPPSIINICATRCLAPEIPRKFWKNSPERNSPAP